MSTASLRRRHAVAERLGAHNRETLSGALTLSHGPSGWGEVGTVAIVEALAIRLAAAMRILNHASDRPRQLAAESGVPDPGPGSRVAGGPIYREIGRARLPLSQTRRIATGGESAPLACR
jgi:hypothetical protein